MGELIKLEFDKQKIDIKTLKKNSRRLKTGLIAPPTEKVDYEIVIEHKAEPIKSLDEIMAVSKYLIENKRYRDNMLFIVGINFGLRVSDLRVLRFSNLINENLMFKESFPVFEKKTRNTRKRKINRYITVNNAVIEAVTLFLENTPDVSLSDYMFRSFSNNSKDKNVPLSSNAIDNILKEATAAVGVATKVSTHTLRKTFCYHQMVMSDNDPRKLLLLQKMLNHSSPAQTLDYIGITNEEIHEAYLHLNLGSETSNYMAISDIYEKEEIVG